MKGRGDSAEQTRQRIVRATYELHAEKGIAATSARDIAARANVAVGSVYHHFPTNDDVLEACGAYTLELARPPDPEIFRAADTPGERVPLLVDALYSFYARFPGLERVRADRDKFPLLEKFMRFEETNRRKMLAKALMKTKVDKRRLLMAFALLDVVVYRTLITGGLSHAIAVRETSGVLCKLLLDKDGSVT